MVVFFFAVLCGDLVGCGVCFFFLEGYVPVKDVTDLLSHRELYKDCKTIPVC